MKIVFVASEGVPHSKTGGLADVVGALPKALVALGHEVDVVLPRYRMTRPGRPLPHLNSLTVPLASGFKFVSMQDGANHSGVQYYLVECPEYFDREGLYQQSGRDYEDNVFRFAAFSLASLEFMKRFAAAPDVIHSHDWQTALVPIYLRNHYRGDKFFEKTSTVFTIHNLGYQGMFPREVLAQLSLPPSLFSIDGLEFFGKVNLLKGAIVFSDFITTVSRKYAEEIQTAEFGYGLEGVLKARKDRLQGILNGVDYEAWDPATDKLIPSNYTSEDLRGKETCKKFLLETLGLRQPSHNRPVLGIVSRFATQKGFDLISGVAEELRAMDVYVVALGTGEPVYERLFKSLAEKHPQKFLVKVAYDNTLAHQIEAGADLFLMPSRYEPCGLNQIYSMKYGTVPVVRATGGLDDTVQDFDGKSGTGFKFSEYSPDALLAALRRAIETYRQPKAWQRLVQNCMSQDFSWSHSAKQYVKIYEALNKSPTKVRAAPEGSDASSQFFGPEVSRHGH